MDYKEAYAKSLRLLNVRFLSEGELRRKLERHDAVGEVIDAVIAKLKEERFVDDERLARAVYKQYAQKGRYGHLYIVNCLRRRDLPVPDELERPDEDETARRLVAQRFKNGADARKIARFLQYRGFSPAVIRNVVDDFYS